MHGSARNRLAPLGPAIPDDTLARAPRAGQPAEAALPLPGNQYAFLTQAGISSATLSIAEAEASRWDVLPHAVLISAGQIAPMAYASALAGSLGLSLAGWDAEFHFGEPDDAGEALLAEIAGLRRAAGNEGNHHRQN